MVASDAKGRGRADRREEGRVWRKARGRRGRKRGRYASLDTEEKKHGLYPRHLVHADDKSPSAGTTSAMGKDEKERKDGFGERGVKGKEGAVINVPRQISQIVRIAPALLRRGST